jgi:hypothetical protein
VYFGSGSVYRIITPVLPSTDAGRMAATNQDGTINVTISIPTDMGGFGIPVQILIIAASVTSPSTSAATAMSDISADNKFSYTDPQVQSLVVVRPRFLAANSTAIDTFNIPCPFTVSDLPWACADSSLLMLVISGMSFGGDPTKLTAQDGITRTLEQQYVDSLTGFLAYSTVPLWLYSWSHTQVVAFTHSVSGVIRISLTSSFTSPPTTHQVVHSYANLSPSISALTGSQGPYASVGGDVITVVVDNLQGATRFAVSIGGVPCKILNAQGQEVTNVTSAIIAAYTADWRFGIVVPPGQGSGNPILITRWDGAASQQSDPGWKIDYVPPLLSHVQVLGGDVNLGNSFWADFPVDALLGEKCDALPVVPQRECLGAT